MERENSRRKIFSFVICIGVLSVCAGCSVSRGADVTLMTWNTQTFFDAAESGTEFFEFRGSRSRWSAAGYARRLERLCAVVRSAVPVRSRIFAGKTEGADIVVLQEVENEAVMFDICNRMTMSDRYGYAAFAGDGGSAFGSGVLSRFPVKKVVTHSLFVDADGVPLLRPVIEIHVSVHGQMLVLFVCHWKSKLGGTEKTDIWRLLQENLLGGCLLSGAGRYGNALFVAAGDFNRVFGEFTYAGGGNGEPAGILLRTFSGTGVTVRSPWPLLETCEDAASGAQLPGGADCVADGRFRAAGSYFYRGKWETIDHFFIY